MEIKSTPPDAIMDAKADQHASNGIEQQAHVLLQVEYYHSNIHNV
jgi:hypothetical protein